MGDADWGGIQQRRRSGQYPGSVLRALRDVRRVPGSTAFRCCRWYANPVSIDCFLPYRGFPPYCDIPSPDLALAAVHLSKLGQAAVAVGRLPGLGHAASAAAAAAAAVAVARRSISQHHLSSSCPRSVRDSGKTRGHRNHRHQPRLNMRCTIYTIYRLLFPLDIPVRRVYSVLDHGQGGIGGIRQYLSCGLRHHSKGIAIFCLFVRLRNPHLRQFLLDYARPSKIPFRLLTIDQRGINILP